MIDKRPAAIARCADANDVATAVRFAAEHALPLAVRGGGDNVAGTAVVDDGLVIDLSIMRAVHIDASRRTVHAQGGATWADVDAVTAPLWPRHAGRGRVRDRRGGTCAERRRLPPAPPARHDDRQPRVRRGRPRRRPPRAGERRRAPGPALGAARRRRQLGVVTSFALRLHELGPEVFALNVAYPIEDAARVLAGWLDAVTDAPDELSTAGMIWSLPVVDELPEQLRGAPYVGVAGMWAGDPAEGERATRALRELATPLLDLSARVDYVDFQRSLDPFFPAGPRR
jgi:FAD/FMN-containing dehydrogenase